MEDAYTKEQINSIPIEELLTLFRAKSRKLYPYCLLGLHIDQVKKYMNERLAPDKVVILIDGESFLMESNTHYWYSKVDQNNMMIDIWSPFYN